MNASNVWAGAPPLSLQDAVRDAVSLRDLPTPPGWPLLGNLLQLRSSRLHRILEDWARAYGPAYRLRVLTKEALVLSDPRDILQVLKERPATFRRSKTIETVMEDMGVSGAVSAEGEAWKRQSRLILQAFNPAHLRGFFPQIVQVTQRLLRRWQASAEKGQAFDIRDDLLRFSLDVTAGLALGSDINTLEGEHTLTRHLERIFPMIARRVALPIPYWRYVKFPADRSFDRSLQALHGAIHEFIAQARARMQARPELREHPANLIEALVASRDEPGSGFSDEDVFGNVFSILLAGAEGAAHTLAWILYFLCEYPAGQHAVQAEADAQLAGQALPLDFERLSGPFPAFDAVVQESMRLKPAFPILLHEARVPARIGAIQVPAGTPIVLLLRMPGLDPAHFPHPERFDPSRWSASAASEEASRRLLFTFGAGPRMCPGRLLTLLELKMVVTMLVRNFTVQRSGSGPVEECLKFTMQPSDFRVRLSARRERSVGTKGGASTVRRPTYLSTGALELY